MLPEDRLRKHLADLAYVRDMPCSCTTRDHAAECQQGHMLIRAAVAVLSWALSENGDYDRVEERFAAGRRRAVAGRKTGRPRLRPGR